ncbi:hypothetical protein, conserved in T. vivax, (fragment) [Trypanosoma vivax Y486]|uniref:Uncharacterized protein n=1 Tax=Trypanosoma vivax (strain Y486) TaxID=1055687 RepID=F9WNA9_TRYVY
MHSATGPKVHKHLRPPRGSLGHRSPLAPHAGTLVAPVRVSACFHLHLTAARPPVEGHAHMRPLAVVGMCARGKRAKCDTKRLTSQQTQGQLVEGCGVGSDIWCSTLLRVRVTAVGKRSALDKQTQRGASILSLNASQALLDASECKCALPPCGGKGHVKTRSRKGSHLRAPPMQKTRFFEARRRASGGSTVQERGQEHNVARLRGTIQHAFTPPRKAKASSAHIKNWPPLSMRAARVCGDGGTSGSGSPTRIVARTAASVGSFLAPLRARSTRASQSPEHATRIASDRPWKSAGAFIVDKTPRQNKQRRQRKQ